MLAMADAEVSGPEGQRLEELARRLSLTSPNTESIRAWVHDYSALLDRFEKLLNAVD